jgi:hypothetical protein
MADTIGESTSVHITLGRLLWGLGSLVVLGVAAFWGVAALATTGLRDDVGAIRASVSTLQTSESANAVNLKQAEVEFARQIAALSVTLATFGGRFDAFGGMVDAVSKSFDQLSDQIAALHQELNRRQSGAIDPDAVVQALTKAGIDDKRIILVPYDASSTPRPR